VDGYEVAVAGAGLLDLRTDVVAVTVAVVVAVTVPAGADAVTVTVRVVVAWTVGSESLAAVLVQAVRLATATVAAHRTRNRGAALIVGSESSHLSGHR
jgi:hypothetical protein